MSIIGVLKRKFNYSVEASRAGRLVYREGNREYTFPIYEEDGEVVVVGTPSSGRVHLFFNWYPSRLEFTPEARSRILPRLEAHLRAEALNVRVFDRQSDDSTGFEFHPQLFLHRNRAIELLEQAGFTWFGDYSSIEAVHENYGLEICGIRQDRDVKPILDALQSEFPHWHHFHYSLLDGGREPGWSLEICMFPPKVYPGECYESD